MSTKSYDAIRDLRRLRVSSLLLRQLSQREIVEALARSKLVNPDTKKPYSLGTVNNDIKYLRTVLRAKIFGNKKADEMEMKE